MKKKDGFTLVELLAVIVLLGIIMTIAIPNALKLGGNVKEQTYVTKIELIEKSAQSYGQSNISSIKSGMSPGSTTAYTCKFDYDDNDDITKAEWMPASSSPANDTNTFPCIKVTIDDLAKSNSLDYDNKSNCGDSCTEEEKKYYDNIVINPKDNSVINNCNVYIYYKYKRVYAYFDRNECNNISPYGTFESGHSYPAKRN